MVNKELDNLYLSTDQLWLETRRRSRLSKLKEQYNQSGQLRDVVKYKGRKMAKSLLKYHCYCPVLLMQTTKIAVCLQIKAIFHQCVS